MTNNNKLGKPCKSVTKKFNCFKILGSNVILAIFLLEIRRNQKNLARFLELARVFQDFARNSFSVFTLRSDNFYISPKSKHNQSLEVKFDEIYTC